MPWRNSTQQGGLTIAVAQAIIDSSKMGIRGTATHKQAVAALNVVLRSKRRAILSLPNPRMQQACNRIPSQSYLSISRTRIQKTRVEYCIQNLADLTVELASQMSLSRRLLLSSSAGIDNGDAIDEQIQESLTRRLHIGCPISIPMTTVKWLRRLGFAYDTRKKSFFVDGHV